MKKFDRSKYQFTWDVLEVILGGKSTIDATLGYPIFNSAQALKFIEHYGCDLSNPVEAAQARGHFQEALSFIKTFFLKPDNPEGLELEIPRRILELDSVEELLLMSNFEAPNQTRSATGKYLRDWSCSILKVMHTISHLDQDLRSAYLPQIQQQILDPFYRLIQREEKKPGAHSTLLTDATDQTSLFFGESPEDPFKIPLVAFETKSKKTRESILIKLLHKPENVAEDIYDRVGIRFVTPTKLDALLLIKYIRDRMLVMPPNLKPSRSRNTLFDLDEFSKALQEVEEERDEQKIVDRLNWALGKHRDVQSNPHSSETYRSVQFTCRQLIKINHSFYQDLRALKNLTKNKELPIHESYLKIIEKIDFKHIKKEVHFFYPYEIQVVDAESHYENEKGRSAHKEYKKAQLRTALRRVMGALVDSTGS